MLIVDDNFGKYFIKLDKSNYEVYKRMTPKAKDGVPGVPYNRYNSCHSSLLAAVDCIIGMNIEDKKDVMPLMDYIKEIRQLKVLFLNITHDDIDKKFASIDKRLKQLEERPATTVQSSIIKL